MSGCTHGNMTAHGNDCPWCELTKANELIKDCEETNAALLRDLLKPNEQLKVYEEALKRIEFGSKGRAAGDKWLDHQGINKIASTALKDGEE